MKDCYTEETLVVSREEWDSIEKETGIIIPDNASFYEINSSIINFIRIHKDDRATVSKSLIKYFTIGNTIQRIKVLIDEVNKLVILKSSTDDTGYKLSLNHHGRSSSYSISCKPLCDKVPYDTYFPKWIENKKILIFNYGDKND